MRWSGFNDKSIQQACKNGAGGREGKAVRDMAVHRRRRWHLLHVNARRFPSQISPREPLNITMNILHEVEQKMHPMHHLSSSIFTTVPAPPTLCKSLCASSQQKIHRAMITPQDDLALYVTMISQPSMYSQRPFSHNVASQYHQA